MEFFRNRKLPAFVGRREPIDDTKLKRQIIDAAPATVTKQDKKSGLSSSVSKETMPCPTKRTPLAWQELPKCAMNNPTKANAEYEYRAQQAIWYSWHGLSPTDFNGMLKTRAEAQVIADYLEKPKKKK